MGDDWVASTLAGAIGFDKEDAMEMAQYVSTMSADDAMAYLLEVLGDAHASTAARIADRLGGDGADTAPKPRRKDSPKMGEKKNGGKRGQSSGQATMMVPTTASLTIKTAASPRSQSSEAGAAAPSGGRSKGKGKYVPMASAKGGALSGLVPGRLECGCNCSKHSLLTNCLRCGRIVCAQEGVGDCFTCGTFVCTPEQAEVLGRGSRKSAQLKKQLEKEAADGLVKAQERKDRLLEYQRTGARRMAVIDDAGDYFSHDSNKWLSEAERAKVKAREATLREKKEAARKANILQIDFAGRKVVARQYDATQDLDEMYAYDESADAVDPKLAEIDAARDAIYRAEAHAAVALNPFLNQPRPEFVSSSSKTGEHATSAGTEQPQKKARTRVQDAGLSEIVDHGVCLSMHQPWASLLVRGIKQHEGRSWYSAHRGRLWIAATAKECDAADATELAEFYASHHPGKVNFPTEYPSGCLLGCVDVVDVLPQDEYSEIYPDGESQSPFVFVCAQPEELMVRFPVKGKHKLWKLDKSIHDAARSGIQPASPGGVRASSEH